MDTYSTTLGANISSTCTSCAAGKDAGAGASVSCSADRVHRVFGCAVAVVFVDSCYYVTHVVGFEECRHLFIEVFRALVGAQCMRMSS